jgi:hypothetical protein
LQNGISGRNNKVFLEYPDIAGLVLARVIVPVTTQQMVGIIMGMGSERVYPPPFTPRQRDLGFEGLGPEGK